jgi:AbrB family looped-hinge helix DNA binding protein
MLYLSCKACKTYLKQERNMKKLPPLPKVYGTVTVGERGQVVIPAKLRRDYKLNFGDKLLVIAGEGGPIGFVPIADFSAFLDQHEKLLAQIKKSVNE